VSRVLDRVGDAGAVLYLVLAGVGYGGLVSQTMPQDLTDPAQVLAHLRSHPAGTAFWVGVFLESLGLVCLLLFAARLAGRIRTVPETGWLGGAALGLAVAGFAVKFASFPTALAALHAARYDASTVTALLDSNSLSDTVSTALDAAFVLLVSLGALSARVLPRWLAGAGVVAALVMLVGVAVPGLFDSLQLVFFLWLVTTSGWLLFRGSRRRADEPVPVPATV
jgi:hypothetical protein